MSFTVDQTGQVKPIIISLSDEEKDLAKDQADNDMSRGWNHTHGYQPSIEEELSNRQNATGAELAVAKVLNKYWYGYNKIKNGPDVSDCIQVRWSPKDKNHLAIYADEDKEKIFIFVTGLMPDYKIQGWILGYLAADHKEWIKQYPNRSPSYFVPSSALNGFVQWNNKYFLAKEGN